jgi:fused signal recognition particle receptor
VRWKFWERKKPPPTEDTLSQAATAEPPIAAEADVEVSEEDTPTQAVVAGPPIIAEAEVEVPEEELAEVVVGESAAEIAQPRQGFLRFLKERLTKTRQGFLRKIDRLLSGSRAIDAELFDELEEVLISGDLGVQTTMRIVQDLQQSVAEQRLRQAVEIRAHLKQSLLDILHVSAEELCTEVAQPPVVILMVGVNGVGKTTTIAKLAYQLKHQGKKVLLAAGDTFRAAAIEQLQEWADRVGVEVIKHAAGADPAAVVYDTIQAAKARRADVVIVDTAGRLHTKVNLMEECKKIKRVIAREHEGAPHEVLLVLDATVGQNGVAQAKQFHEALGLTGLVMTKLDGTAKGGIVVSIVNELKIPVKLIGVGEKLPDLQPFDPTAFTEALFDD